MAWTVSRTLGSSSTTRILDRGNSIRGPREVRRATVQGSRMQISCPALANLGMERGNNEQSRGACPRPAHGGITPRSDRAHIQPGWRERELPVTYSAVQPERI